MHSFVGNERERNGDISSLIQLSVGRIRIDSFGAEQYFGIFFIFIFIYILKKIFLNKMDDIAYLCNPKPSTIL